MVVSLKISDVIARQLHLDGEQGERRALEMLALEGYRAGSLSRGQLSEMLDLEFNETEHFLKEHEAYIPLSMVEYRRGAQGLETFLAQ